MGGIDGLAGFCFAHPRRGAQAFISGRVGHGEGGAVIRIAPAAIDIALLAKQGVVSEGNRHRTSPELFAACCVLR